MVTNIHRLEGTIIDTQNVRICTHVCLCVFYGVLSSGLWSPGSGQCKAGSARHGAKTLAVTIWPRLFRCNKSLGWRRSAANDPVENASKRSTTWKPAAVARSETKRCMSVYGYEP